MCEWPGCEQLASEVDHRIPIADGGREFREENLQALCHRHHALKTVIDQRKIKEVRATEGRGA